MSEVKIEHPNVRKLRCGRFHVPYTYLREMNLAVLRPMFEGLVVYSARPDFACDGIEYIGFHDGFDEVEIPKHGLLVYNDYQAVMDSIPIADGSGYTVKFNRWQRIDHGT